MTQTIPLCYEADVWTNDTLYIHKREPVSYSISWYYNNSIPLYTRYIMTSSNENILWQESTGQYRGALMFSLICSWTNGWAYNWDTGDFRRHRTHYALLCERKYFATIRYVSQGSLIMNIRSSNFAWILRYDVFLFRISLILESWEQFHQYQLWYVKIKRYLKMCDMLYT